MSHILNAFRYFIIFPLVDQRAQEGRFIQHLTGFDSIDFFIGFSFLLFFFYGFVIFGAVSLNLSELISEPERKSGISHGIRTYKKIQLKHPRSEARISRLEDNKQTTIFSRRLELLLCEPDIKLTNQFSPRGSCGLLSHMLIVTMLLQLLQANNELASRLQNAMQWQADKQPRYQQ